MAHIKTVHNVRMRAITSSEMQTRALLAHASTMARKSDETAIPIVIVDDDDDRYIEGQVWFERQPEVRKFVAVLREELGADACNYIRENPTRFLDTGSHCFILLDVEAFANGKCVLATSSQSVSVRLNIAAWPPRRENVIKVLQSLFY